MNDNLNIIITGIGGQGTVSIGHILGKAFNQEGYSFLAAETHGMSQRGGSVVFHLRLGEVKAPIIGKGMADIIISGEPMEALRVIDYLKPGGIVITNTHGILSPVAAQLGMKYPSLDDILNHIKEWPSKLYSIDTGKIASELNLKRGENLILLGAFLQLGLVSMESSVIENMIISRWPQFKEDNLKALNAGYEFIKNYKEELIV